MRTAGSSPHRERRSSTPGLSGPVKFPCKSLGACMKANPRPHCRRLNHANGASPRRSTHPQENQHLPRESRDITPPHHGAGESLGPSGPKRAKERASDSIPPDRRYSRRRIHPHGKHVQMSCINATPTPRVSSRSNPGIAILAIVVNRMFALKKTPHRPARSIAHPPAANPADALV